MGLKAILLGILTLTSYRPIPQQTRPGCVDKNHCYTSMGDLPTVYGCAISPDMLARNGGPIHFGDILYIDGFGFRVVNDVMGPRNRKAVDLMVWTREQEHRVGVRRQKVWVCRMQKS